MVRPIAGNAYAKRVSAACRRCPNFGSGLGDYQSYAFQQPHLAVEALFFDQVGH
jgi:hypothetical protein